MVDYGFLAYNDSESVVIDSSFVNYVFKSSGTTNIVAGINYINLPNTNAKVIFAFRPPPTRFVAHWGYVFVGTTLTHARVVSSGNESLQWVMFQEVPAVRPPTGTYGALFFDETEKITFSSEENYLKYVQDFEGTENTTVTPQSISNYFYTWSPIAKVDWRYTQTHDILTYYCPQNTVTWTRHGSITNNYRKGYVVGIKKSGSDIQTGWVLHSNNKASSNTQVLNASSITCNGYTTHYAGGMETGIKVEKNGSIFGIGEITDPAI